ncbi:conserved Plasmodium protein, unknown function [Plasmodium sp. gorilla clade G1]|nr:conserved Plasmodium protein, unknown function [Plasmodium sp. gorilla clade G1]
MSYLLDDKKIILKNLITKNESIKTENENMTLENKALLCLIKKYEEKNKFLNVVEYIHYVCTNLYSYEENLNYNIMYDEFLKDLKKYLKENILDYKHILENILLKTDINYVNEQNIVNDILSKKKIYDISFEEVKNTTMKSEYSMENIKTSVKTENKDISLNKEECNKDDHVQEDNIDKYNGLEGKNREKNICRNWKDEKSEHEFYQLQSFEKNENREWFRVDPNLNLKEKQQLIYNEIEKLKNEIKKITVHSESTKIIISSMICQSKIFLYELEDNIKDYKILKEKIMNDKYLLKKGDYINEVYNGIIQNQRIKIDNVKKTNKTLLNLYNKKFSNINYIISLNENINNVDFLYLNVLIHNRKLQYDDLMKEHENNYNHLRKLLSNMSNIQNKITEYTNKEKEILSNIEKNNDSLNLLDNLIVDITNKIDTNMDITNKKNQNDDVDFVNNYSVLECIQINKDISTLEKKISSYERKIHILKNLKMKT